MISWWPCSSLVALILVCNSLALPSIEVAGGWGSIVLRDGNEPVDEVERFSQITRAATGHEFSKSELQGFVDALCGELLATAGTRCQKTSIGPPISVELGGLGTIEVKEGQFPGEAIDDFLVKAKGRGVQGLSEEGVTQVLEYLCSRKACYASALSPKELAVQNMGVVTVGVGEEVADAVERFAYAARDAGHALNLAGVGQIAARLCQLKTCNRPVNLAPTRLEVQGLGTVVVPFDVEPADAVESFAAQVSAQASGGTLLLPQDNVDQIMDALCAKRKCAKKQLKPVSLPVQGVGTVVVAVGQEPADAARRFLDEALASGHAIGAAGAEVLMRALCDLKRCSRPLDLSPATLAVQGVGTIVVPLGADPTKALEDWLESAREAGHRLTGTDAATLMERLCSQSTAAGGGTTRGLALRCTRPLDTSPLRLKIADAAAAATTQGGGEEGLVLEVPFGAEPAEAAAQFLERAMVAGHAIDGGSAQRIMEALCARKKCNLPLDVSPLTLDVNPLGTLSVPFGVEPSLAVMAFLVEARAGGAMVDAQGATQLMEAVCARRTCHVPLDVSGYSLDVQGVGRFVVPFGSEPAAALTSWVLDQVVPAGGAGLVNAQGAARIMEDACKNVSCLVPLDVRPVSVPVQGVGTVSVPFGHDPTAAVESFLKQAIQAGHPVTAEFGSRLMEAVCSAGRARSPLSPGGGGQQSLTYCHRPLRMDPFTLDVQGVGTLKVPWGTEAALAVARFASEALDAGHYIDKNAVDLLMARACAGAGGSTLCSLQVDTNATTLNVTGLGVVEVEFGADVASTVRKFVSHAVYEGRTLTVGDVNLIMENLCSRLKCRNPLDLSPAQVPVEGVGTLVVPFTAVPQQAVRAFGNEHRLSPYAMQQVLDALCTKVPCEAEITKK